MAFDVPVDASPDCILHGQRCEGIDLWIPDEFERSRAVEEAVVFGVERRVQRRVGASSSEGQFRLVLERNQVQPSAVDPDLRESRGSARAYEIRPERTQRRKVAGDGPCWRRFGA